MTYFKRCLTSAAAVAIGMGFAGTSNAATFECAATSHIYEFVVTDCGKSWDSARIAAEASGGYLVTITSDLEQACLEANTAGVPEAFYYAGGNDAAVEDEWRWQTGPETGTQFWQGEGGGSNTAPDNYDNWSNNEPNDNTPAGQDFLDWNSGNGFWGDISDEHGSVCGYIFESDVLPGVKKEITSFDGEDLGENDPPLVVEVGQALSTAYDFTITYTQADDTDVVVVDTTPAEWKVTAVNDETTGTTTTQELPLDCGESTVMDGVEDVTVFKGGKSGKNCKNSTHLWWTPDTAEAESSLKVDVETRESPGKGHTKRGGDPKFAPTSCGALYLNDGAAVYVADENGDPITKDEEGNPIEPLFISNALCLAAVSDLNGGGLQADGEGDEDGDGISDWNEACNVEFARTNPCLADTDDDGVNDDEDNCPLTPNPLQEDNYGTSLGDACEDTDLDGTLDDTDNCPTDANADQADGDLDGAGDVCDPAECGNGFVEGDEQCDDGNTEENDSCSNLCVTQTDADGDLFFTGAGGDCDDVLFAVNPDATEVCNGIDDNCAGGIDEGLECPI